MPAEATYYVIARRRGNEAVSPVFDLGRGELAVMVFTTRAKAEAFRAARLTRSRWRVAGLTAAELVGWLQTHRAYGAGWVCLDPRPSGTAQRMVRSEAALARLEGRDPT